MWVNPWSSPASKQNWALPVSEKQNEQNNEQAVASDPKLIVSALFASSGAVAPVDFARFGQRVGEIIARAGGPRREPPRTGTR